MLATLATKPIIQNGTARTTISHPLVAVPLLWKMLGSLRCARRIDHEPGLAMAHGRFPCRHLFA